MKMTLSLRGTTYESDFMDLLKLTIGESRTIKRNCRGPDGQSGMTGADWRQSMITLDREDPDLLAGIVFLLRSRAGEAVEWSDIEDLTSQEFAEGMAIVEDEPPDPTPEPDVPAEVNETTEVTEQPTAV